jgi:hypothetical protein
VPNFLPEVLLLRLYVIHLQDFHPYESPEVMILTSPKLPCCILITKDSDGPVDPTINPSRFSDPITESLIGNACSGEHCSIPRYSHDFVSDFH